jgi:hypothetical protein
MEKAEARLYGARGMEGEVLAESFCRIRSGEEAGSARRVGNGSAGASPYRV